VKRLRKVKLIGLSMSSNSVVAAGKALLRWRGAGW